MASPLKLLGLFCSRKKKAAAKDKSKILEQIVSSKKQEEEKKRTLDKRTPAQLAYEKMQEKRVWGQLLLSSAGGRAGEGE